MAHQVAHQAFYKTLYFRVIVGILIGIGETPRERSSQTHSAPYVWARVAPSSS